MAVKSFVFGDEGWELKYLGCEHVPADKLGWFPEDDLSDPLGVVTVDDPADPLGEVPVDIPTDSTPNNSLDGWSKEMFFLNMSPWPKKDNSNDLNMSPWSNYSDNSNNLNMLFWPKKNKKHKTQVLY
jgi:hypothetical protein